MNKQVRINQIIETQSASCRQLATDMRTYVSAQNVAQSHKTMILGWAETIDEISRALTVENSKGNTVAVRALMKGVSLFAAGMITTSGAFAANQTLENFTSEHENLITQVQGQCAEYQQVDLGFSLVPDNYRQAVIDEIVQSEEVPEIISTLVDWQTREDYEAGQFLEGYGTQMQAEAQMDGMREEALGR